MQGQDGSAEQGPAGTNEELRQELLALAEAERSFLKSPERDADSDVDQRRLLNVMGQLRGRFVEVLDEYGWPGKTLVGEDGAQAAWSLALRTMPEPAVLSRCLELMREAASLGEADLSGVGFLVDRLALIERGVQVYGTVICRMEDGSFGAPSLEDPDSVEDRRRSVGLIPLDEDIRRIEGFHVGESGESGAQVGVSDGLAVEDDEDGRLRSGP